MVQISYEPEETTHARLAEIFKKSEIKHLNGIWSFQENPRDNFPSCVKPEALAIVLDETTCSQLVLADPQVQEEIFKLFCIHFPDNADNSGFVGWLASLIKKETGSGVFVTCGYNAKRGGIFDYWGYPPKIEPQVKALLDKLAKA
jgi:hypothetical protein